MDCSTIRQQVDAYVDRELDVARAAAIDRHLASCEACDAIFSRQAQLRRALREHVTYHDASPALAARIRARLPAAHATPAQSRRRWGAFLPRLQWLQFGAAVAATALLSWTAGVQYASLSEDELVAGQVMAGHARSLLTSHVTDVATSDQHTVKPWLSRKLDFSPPVTDLTPVGFPLLGGRLDYLDGRPVAALAYQHRQHLINLFVWPDHKASSAATQTFSKDGYNVLRWTEGGLAFWAVSDLNAGELKDFAQAYASAK